MSLHDEIIKQINRNTYEENFMQTNLGIKAKHSGLKKISTKYFSGQNAWEFIFSHIFAPLKLLVRPYAYLMHPDFVFIKTVIIK